LIVPKRDGDERAGAVSAVKRFRDPHHRVARLFASGLKLKEVAERCGYSYNRISQLANDPAFQELIAKYRMKVDKAFVENIDDFYEQATSNMRTAERMIAEKLEKADEDDYDIPLKTLVDISGDRMDRFGYGKRQTNLNVNADFASLLEKAIARSGKTIEGGLSLSVPQSPPRITPSQSPANLPSEESFPIEAKDCPPTPQSATREESSRLPARVAAPQPSSEPFRRRA